MDSQKGNYPEYAEGTLHPGVHNVGSSQTGSVSCTTSMDMIKEYSKYSNNYVYMVKAVGGFHGTNDREVEKEVTVPGGIDSEDIIAFRQLNKGAFDSQQPLYININFIRRYPDLLDYILNHYLEEHEDSPAAEKTIAAIPGMQSQNSLSITTSLQDVKLAVLEILNEYTAGPHKLRIEEIKKAINAAKDIDNIWYILNNQFDIFEIPYKRQGTIPIPGLTAQFYNATPKRLDGSLKYRSVIRNALSILPRINPLVEEHKKVNKEEKSILASQREQSLVEDQKIYLQEQHHPLVSISSDPQRKYEKKEM